jgi:hypothetical protein
MVDSVFFKKSKSPHRNINPHFPFTIGILNGGLCFFHLGRGFQLPLPIVSNRSGGPKIPFSIEKIKLESVFHRKFEKRDVEPRGRQKKNRVRKKNRVHND